jgi:hypothetical protein
MKTSLRAFVRLGAIALSILFAASASSQTAATYVSGHISNVTFAGDYLMIMVDAGLPDNCVGTGWGWMKIPPENKPMIAFVTGLWMRGDAAQVVVTVYTDGLVGGYCRISQLDPQY